MRSVTDDVLGIIARTSYRLEIRKTSAPKQKDVPLECDYLYITKIDHKGAIGDHSIGLPAADVLELQTILSRF